MIPPPSAPAPPAPEPEFNVIYWSTTSRFCECLNEAVPATTKLPSTFKSLNVTLSVVSKPKSIVVTTPALSVISISPCGIPVPEE